MENEHNLGHRPSIFYVLPLFDLETDNHFYHIYQLLALLAEQFEVHLVVERGNKPPIGQFASVWMLPSQGSFLKVRRAWKMLRTALAARLAGCKLVYTHQSRYGGIVASGVFRLTGGKALYWNCGLVGMFKEPLVLNLQRLALKFSKEFPLWLTLRTVNVLVTGTETVGKHYVESYGISPKKIRIMPNWVSLKRFDPGLYGKAECRRQLGLSPAARVVLFVHRIVERKGADRILPIAKKVLERAEDALFLVVGDGPYFNDLRSQVQAASIGDRVILKGKVANREIPTYYGASDVLIMPSREEGFPRVLIEAMAMGVPFVATSVGGVQDLTTELQQRFTVSPYDDDTFAANVCRILQDESLHQQLSEEGLMKVREYELKRVAARFKQILREVGER